MLAGDPVSDHRIGEHVGAVAERGDDEGVRRGELGAERGAETPAETAGGAEREQRVRLLARDLRRAQRIFVEDHGVGADRLADRSATGIPAKSSRRASESLTSCARRLRMRSVSRARRAAMRASAICRRGSSASTSAASVFDGSRPGWRDRSESCASDSARRTGPRRYARRGSRQAGVARAESMARRRRWR